jgi:hypothetical protein
MTDVCNGLDKKILASSDDILVSLIGKITIAVRSDGFRFSSKLIEIRGNGPNPEIWFENRTGLRWMVRRDAICSISELAARGP